MFKLKSRLASGLAAAALAAGLAVAQGVPGLGQPAQPTAPQPIQVEMLNNANKGYQIGYPTGWQVIAGADEIDYGFLSPDQNAFCVSASFAIPDLASVSNDQLRQALAVPQGEEFWRNMFFGQFPNVNYLHVGADANPPGGWPVQTVIARVQAEAEGQKIDATFAGILTFKSGSLFRVMCYATTEGFDQYKGPFFAVFSSFKITK